MKDTRKTTGTLRIAAIAIALAMSTHAAGAAGAPLAFGEPFPAESYPNLNPEHGGVRVDLAGVLGKRPVVLFYFIPKHLHSEEALAETIRVLRDAPGDVALYAVTAVASGQDPAPVTERVRELGLDVPVLMDTDFDLGKRLKVQAVPSITAIDAEGKLRLANAGSLKQDLEYKMKVSDGLRRLAETGKIGTYGMLPRYDPAVELIGEKAPDFVATGTDGIARRWSSLIDPRKVNVLIYWSVTCPHCRKTLPQISDWVKKNGGGVNVLSAAKVENEAMKVRTKEFTKLHGLAFPTVLDVDDEIFTAYKITATPTLFVVGPDGTVDSLLSASGDFGAQVEKRKKELLAGSGG